MSKTDHPIDGVPNAGHATSFPVEKIGLLPRKKMCLELAEALQEVRERWGISESGENCAQETFRGHLDSKRLKLTAICTAAIATLPRTSFPDDNFASCLLIGAY